jgi:predicted small metal-binding protein
MNAFGPERFVSHGWTCPFGVMHTLHFIHEVKQNVLQHFKFDHFKTNISRQLIGNVASGREVSDLQAL